jgi:hypothetical protein
VRRLLLVSLSFAWIGLQSCTPVFAQDDKPVVVEKKPNEASAWDKVKAKTDDAVDFGTEKSKDISRELGTTRSRRQDSTYTLNVNYALFEM